VFSDFSELQSSACTSQDVAVISVLQVITSHVTKGMNVYIYIYIYSVCVCVCVHLMNI